MFFLCNLWTFPIKWFIDHRFRIYSFMHTIKFQMLQAASSPLLITKLAVQTLAAIVVDTFAIRIKYYKSLPSRVHMTWINWVLLVASAAEYHSWLPNSFPPAGTKLDIIPEKHLRFQNDQRWHNFSIIKRLSRSVSPSVGVNNYLLSCPANEQKYCTLQCL